MTNPSMPDIDDVLADEPTPQSTVTVEDTANPKPVAATVRTPETAPITTPAGPATDDVEDEAGKARRLKVLRVWTVLFTVAGVIGVAVMVGGALAGHREVMMTGAAVTLVAVIGVLDRTKRSYTLKNPKKVKLQ